MPADRMVLLTTVANPLTARILAAHLGSEGVVWQLRGNVDGPYPVGPVEVLVGEEDVEVASEVLTALDDPGPLPEDFLAPDPEPQGIRSVVDARHRRARRVRWTALVIAVVFAAQALRHLLTMAL